MLETTGSTDLELVDFLSTLATALVASFHCAGMCGGFVLLAPGKRNSFFSAQSLYHTGKTTVYLGLGALAGFLGQGLSVHGGVVNAIEWLALVAGVFLIATGFGALGLVGGVLGKMAAGPAALAHVRAFLRAALTYRGPLRGLVLGTLSGLLPCPLVYAFLAKAASSGSTLNALATMSALALGTAPVLLVTALSGKILPPMLRLRLVRMSGVFMVLLGIFTIWRGFYTPLCCSPPA